MAVYRLGYSRVGVAEVDRYLFDVAALFLDEQRSASMAEVVKAYMADASADRRPRQRFLARLVTSRSSWVGRRLAARGKDKILVIPAWGA